MPKHSDKNQPTLLLGNQLFNVLRKIAELVLPAAGALYFALAQIWNWPNAEQVVGSIAAVNTFVGAIVLAARKSYNSQPEEFDGQIDVSKLADGPVKWDFQLKDGLDPLDLGQRQEIRLKINDLGEQAPPPEEYLDDEDENFRP